MICEIIVFKTVCRIFLIFCRSSFINNFMVRSNFRELKNYWKLNILQPIYFLKNLHIILKALSVKISQENFSFRKMFFWGLEAFFTTAKPLIWASLFCWKYWFNAFVQGWLFNFNIILKTCFKNLCRKTEKMVVFLF